MPQSALNRVRAIWALVSGPKLTKRLGPCLLCQAGFFFAGDRGRARTCTAQLRRLCSIRLSYEANLGNGEASVVARRVPAGFIKPLPRAGRVGLHPHWLSVLCMTPAQALSALWIAMTLGLAGCVSPSRETANTRCLEEVASSASYMSGGAPWDLATNPSDRSRGYVPGYRQRLEQDARSPCRSS